MSKLIERDDLCGLAPKYGVSDYDIYTKLHMYERLDDNPLRLMKKLECAEQLAEVLSKVDTESLVNCYRKCTSRKGAK